MKYSSYFAEKYNLIPIFLPDQFLKTKGGKDVSDFIALGGDVKILQEMVDKGSARYEEICVPKDQEESSEENSTETEDKKSPPINKPPTDYDGADHGNDDKDEKQRGRR